MVSPSNQNEKRFGKPDEVYAVGAIVIAWNFCENSLAFLLQHIIKVDHKTVTRIFELLSNQSRVDLVRLEGKQRLTQGEFDVLSAYLSAYLDCLENRNLVAHSQIKMNGAKGGLSLQKRSSKDRITFNRFHIPSDELLYIADTTYDLAQHGYNLAVSLAVGPHGGVRIREDGPLLPAPLPDKFPRPRKLNPIRPEDR